LLVRVGYSPIQRKLDYKTMLEMWENPG